MTIVNNEEYVKACNNIENKRIMRAASRKYRGLIPEDELKQCNMIALWLSMEAFNPTGGRQFTSYLYEGVIQSCRRWLHANIRPMEQLPFELSVSNFNGSDVRDMIGLLPENLQAIINQRFFDNMTYREIADIHGVSYETIRKRIKKALWKMSKTSKSSCCV
jgi:RNA polymerase sigma factor (sigma-70 family)